MSAFPPPDVSGPAKEAWLTEALAQARGQPELEVLMCQIDRALADLRAPLRVAVVGLIKAGKSTLLNALLGEPVLPVGIVETTYTVAQLSWNATPSVRLHFKDGRIPTQLPWSDLEKVVRRGEDLEFLRSISLVDIGHPNPLLKQMTLIDTPGLGSTHIHDSQNTMETLGLLKDAKAATEKETRAAEAVLYVFSRSLHTSDQGVLSALQGTAFGKVSPLNAIAALSQIDMYWPQAIPLEDGARIAGRLIQDAHVRRTLYGILPVAGLPAGGARTLGDDDHEALRRLARMPLEAFNRLLRDNARFAERDVPTIPVLPPARARLLDLLGAWGVWRCCEALRTDPQADLYGLLAEQSGVGRLRETLLKHFGARARLIKLNSVLPALREGIFTLRRTLPPESEARHKLDNIAASIERAESGDLAFAQLKVLQDFYAGRLDLDEVEAKELCHVTGEAGDTVAARLGANPDATSAALRSQALALIGRWNAKASGADGHMGTTQTAARVVARSLEAIAVTLNIG